MKNAPPDRGNSIERPIFSTFHFPLFTFHFSLSTFHFPLSTFLFPFPLSLRMIDLLLRGGVVIDGSGAPRRPADVAVQRDRIVAVEPLADAVAGRVIDCSGMIVAPGFVDVHTHADGWLLKTPNFESKTAQGFTTEVLMSDGISYAPVSLRNAAEWIYYLHSLNGLELSDYCGWQSIADYMALLDRRTAQNALAQIPYANLRVLAKGWGRAPPDDGQLRHMQQMVAEAMEAGAVGISTGLDYIAQCFATTDEIAEVCQAMRPWQGLYATHVRYKKGILAGVQEAVEIGRRAGVPVHISHLKCDDAAEADDLLAYIDRVATRDVDFSFDVYPYTPGSTMLNYFLAYEVWETGPLEALAKLTGSEVRLRLAAMLKHPARPKLDKIRIAWVGSKAGSRFQGWTVEQYVAHVGRSPADALCELLMAENMAVLLVVTGGEEELVEPFLAHSRHMVGSDGIYFPDGLVHPRQFGTAPRMLGHMVRTRALMSLEEAVRKLSGWPAERFRLLDRGLVRPGAVADLVVFRPESVADAATYDAPRQLPIGIEHVLVGGVPVIDQGRAVYQWPDGPPGRALRAGA
jgi:N-acyl-D-amino-acid deacylase